MRKLIPLFFLAVLLVNCTEKITRSDVNPQLEIIVKTESGQLVTNASVSLFLTEEDWKDNINIIQSGNTNNEGSILFTDLEEIQYYFFASKGEMNNQNQISETNKILEINVKAIIETIIK